MSKIRNGYIEISIEEMYASLDDKQRHEFLRTLAWTDDVFEDVEKELLGGFATNSYNSNIYKLRKSLLEQSGVMEKSFMRDLLWELKRAHKDEHLVRSNMYHINQWVNEMNTNLPDEKKIKLPLQYGTNDKYTYNEFIDMMIAKHSQGEI